MKVTLDTDVLVSGIFFRGPPFEILKIWKNEDKLSKGNKFDSFFIH